MKTPGLQLKERRDQLGLSQEDIASQLHISLRILERLERDEYSSMRDELLFQKGYLKAYGRFLGLSEKDLSEGLEQLLGLNSSDESLMINRKESLKKQAILRPERLPALLEKKQIKKITGATVFFTIIIVFILGHYFYNAASVVSTQSASSHSEKSTPSAIRPIDQKEDVVEASRPNKKSGQKINNLHMDF